MNRGLFLVQSPIFYSVIQRILRVMRPIKHVMYVFNTPTNSKHDYTQRREEALQRRSFIPLLRIDTCLQGKEAGEKGRIQNVPYDHIEQYMEEIRNHPKTNHRPVGPPPNPILTSSFDLKEKLRGKSLRRMGGTTTSRKNSQTFHPPGCTRADKVGFFVEGV